MNIDKTLLEKLYKLTLSQSLEKSDVIIWLQGDRLDRGPKVLKLYRAGWSKKILISGNNILIGKKPRPGEKNISLLEMEKWLLKNGVKEKELVIDNGAMNTKDQAEHVMNLALKKKWQKIILVGSSYYQPRAFLTFLKQAKKIRWDGIIINQPVIINWDEKPAGRDKTARIIFNEESEKIKKYKKNLASMEEGIKYLNKNDD
jgi:uncharacterized SAM-binding protein YcdF (DUF218 family)